MQDLVMMNATDLLMMNDGSLVCYKKVFDVGESTIELRWVESQRVIEVELLLRAVCELRSEVEGVW